MMNKINKPILLKRLLTSNNGFRSISTTSQQMEKNYPLKTASPLSEVDVKKIDPFTDVETHTGHRFEENDYRLSRFIGGKMKKVNTRFAIDLIAEIPPKAVKGRFVACDGGGGPLGHPKVFINLDQPGNHSCGYCGLRFYQEHSDHHH